MSAGGGPAKRISFGEGHYSTPVWSPRGDLIAFTKFDSSTFYIGICKPDGSGERLLTQSFLVEGPTVAARATRNIFVPVAIAVASAAIPPLPYRTYRNATDLGVLPI